MACVSLKMISLGSLLIFNDLTSSSPPPPLPPPAGRSRCITESELHTRVDKYRRSYWDTLSVSTDRLPQRDIRDIDEKCAETAKLTQDLRHRSLSPWTYILDRDVDRFPSEIAFAKCLCRGCIINQREDLSYNSVPVSALLMVLRTTRCPQDPNKYMVKKVFIKVPVACVCAVPKYR